MNNLEDFEETAEKDAAKLGRVTERVLETLHVEPLTFDT